MNTELNLIIERLNKNFDWNQERIMKWLTTSNLYLNFATPMDFVEKNLGYKVLEILED